jgi:hypothetical protein
MRHDSCCDPSVLDHVNFWRTRIVAVMVVFQPAICISSQNFFGRDVEGLQKCRSQFENTPSLDFQSERSEWCPEPVFGIYSELATDQGGRRPAGALPESNWNCARNAKCRIFVTILSEVIVERQEQMKFSQDMYGNCTAHGVARRLNNRVRK